MIQQENTFHDFTFLELDAFTFLQVELSLLYFHFHALLSSYLFWSFVDSNVISFFLLSF
jgi:hypothetical protein